MFRPDDYDGSDEDDVMQEEEEEEEEETEKVEEDTIHQSVDILHVIKKKSIKDMHSNLKSQNYVRNFEFSQSRNGINNQVPRWTKRFVVVVVVMSQRS